MLQRNNIYFVLYAVICIPRSDIFKNPFSFYWLPTYSPCALLALHYRIISNNRQYTACNICSICCLATLATCCCSHCQGASLEKLMRATWNANRLWVEATRQPRLTLQDAGHTNTPSAWTGKLCSSSRGECGRGRGRKQSLLQRRDE